MEENEYADLEWAKKDELGKPETKIIGGKKWDIKAINDLTDQKLRDMCEETDDNGLPSTDMTKYRKEFLKTSVVRPKVSDQFIDSLRQTKKSGTYSKLYNAAAKVSGITLSILEIEEEKNLESPTESIA